MKRWLKAELHAHTVEDPLDGRRIIFHSPQDLIDAAAGQGFEVLSITNHNQMLFDSELDEYARRRGIVLIPGVEATLRRKHVLLYNFPAYHPTWRDFEVVRQNKGTAQLVVAPHPFFPIPTSLRGDFLRNLDLFDALEYNHFYLRFLNFNRKAQKMARRHRLPLLGNSDVHRLYQLGCTYTLIHAEKNVGAIVEAIKRGDVELASEPVSPFLVVGWLLGNALYRSRFALRSLFSCSHLV